MNKDDGISPWRNAKPRKPIGDYLTPSSKSPNFDASSLSDADLYQELFHRGVNVGPVVPSTRNIYRRKLEQILNGKSPQSPPNSGYKESTRMEASLDSSSSLKMDLSGASPNLFRGGEEKSSKMRSSKASNSRSKENSFTKLKSVSRSTPLQKKNRSKTGKNTSEDNSESEESSEADDDQPSGSCQFVGEASMASNMSSSTLNNTMGSTASMMRKGNKHSSKQIVPESAISAASITEPDSPPPKPKSRSLCSCLGCILAVAVAMLAYAIVLEDEGTPALLSSTPEQLSVDHWKHTKDMFRSDLRSLMSKFPNQTKSTWQMISATLKSPMEPRPEYPAVLMLLSSSSSLVTANCLANKLVDVSSKSFSKPGLVPPAVPHLVIPASSLPSLDPNTAKEQLTSILHSSLSSWGVAAVTSVHQLHAKSALTLHAFADNSNAPYKQAVIILTLSDEVEGELDMPSSLEKRVERILSNTWSKELGADKLYALISRLAVSVAQVQDEEAMQVSNC